MKRSPSTRPTHSMLPYVEGLENRVLLAASLDLTSGILDVKGSETADVITVRIIDEHVVVRTNGMEEIFPAEHVVALTMDAAEGNDRIVVNLEIGFDTTIVGGSGNDRIRGGGGNDLIQGTEGMDWLAGRDGADRLEGGSGRDRIWGQAGDDSIEGGSGNDQLRGGGGSDSLDGGDGNDFLAGQRGDDTLSGGDGDDRLRGGAGDDVETPGLEPEIPTAAGPSDPPVKPEVVLEQYFNLSEGWDGAGRGSAQLSYHLGNVPRQFVPVIETALDAWGAVAAIEFTETSQSRHEDSIEFRFANIDGSGGTLAEAYLPDDINRNPVAGNVTFDQGENWEIGNSQGSAAFDILLIAVHEIGHALGVDHIEDRKSVMDDTVSSQSSFRELDQSSIDSVLEIYAGVGNPDGPIIPNQADSNPESDTSGGESTPEEDRQRRRRFWRRYY